jgi:hypothetical protein
MVEQPEAGFRSFEMATFFHPSQQDANMVSRGFVTKGSQLLGALYGADGTTDLTGNQIFGRWLEKKSGLDRLCG